MRDGSGGTGSRDRPLSTGQWTLIHREGDKAGGSVPAIFMSQSRRASALVGFRVMGPIIGSAVGGSLGHESISGPHSPTQ